MSCIHCHSLLHLVSLTMQSAMKVGTTYDTKEDERKPINKLVHTAQEKSPRPSETMDYKMQAIQ